MSVADFLDLQAKWCELCGLQRLSRFAGPQQVRQTFDRFAVARIDQVPEA